MAKTAKSIQFEIDVLKKADAYSKKMKISRNQIINEALKLWIKEADKKILALKLKEASREIQASGKEKDDPWDITLSDGFES